MTPRLIPELDVSNLDTALEFYVSQLGFRVLYERPEERFAMLEFEGARVMLEETAGPGRRFRTAPLEQPYGRGINLQIQASDAHGMFGRLVSAGATIVLSLEEKWYRSGEFELGNHQFVVADPDGYLLRFFTDLGSRPLGQ